MAKFKGFPYKSISRYIDRRTKLYTVHKDRIQNLSILSNIIFKIPLNILKFNSLAFGIKT